MISQTITKTVPTPCPLLNLRTGRAIISIGATPQQYLRLDPMKVGRPLFPLDEWNVPTKFQDFWEIEPQIALGGNENKTSFEQTLSDLMK